jgi:RNA polymerase sigma factor (sigma-70 family)
MEASAAPGPATGTRHRGLVPARLLRVASDDRLVDEVRKGSQRAFEVVYDRHHRGLLAFCRHMLTSREEAEDAVQHTFMAAYRDMASSDKPIQLRAWLYTIARNRCLSVLRARRDRPVDELEDIPTEGLATEVQRRADLRDLLRDLAGLPEDQRAALVLAELGDLPHDEIAAVLGCRKEKVKALVFQARSSLLASREARSTDCSEVRELLSTLRGGALRRTTLRRHVKDCPGCQAFRDEVERQRRAMALVLPVVPTLGLKGDVLGTVFGTKAAAGAAAGLTAAGGAGTGGTGAAATAATGTAAATGVAAGGGATVLAAKVMVVAVAATGGAVGVKSATDGPPAKPASVEQSGKPGGSGAGKSAPAGAAPVGLEEREGDKPGRGREGARGHTDRGKRFAEGRGKGRKRGLRGTQPGKHRAEKPQRRGGPDNAANERSSQKGRPADKPQRTGGPAEKPRRTPEPKAVKTPRPQPVAPPKPVRTPRPAPTPEPTPVPTAVPTEAPAVAPTAEADSATPTSGKRGVARTQG